jgi:ADP-ribose pyrophosphatase YjhB (NUDIX family)
MVGSLAGGRPREGKGSLDGATLSFISRRESQFRDYPPASAESAIVLPFFGNLTVWVRSRPEGRWHFPVGTRRSGETIGDVAKRQLWEATRLVAPKLDLLGCLAQPNGRPRVAYVYICETDRLPWAFDRPEGVAEVGAFVNPPKPIEANWYGTLLEAAQKARRTGLR